MERRLDVAISGLVVLNVLAVILESYASLKTQYQAQFYTFEVFSVVVFSMEYTFRVGKSIAKGSVGKYIFSLGGLIDLLAVLPFFLPQLMPLDLRAARILRLTRLMRLLKLRQYHHSLRLISSVFREKQAELRITLLVTFLLLLFSSVMMFYVEGDDQPEAFPNIPATFWWAVATLTTVGYGDIYPITGIGRLISGTIALLGIGVIALPTGILSAAFMEKLSDEAEGRTNDCTDLKSNSSCPHCGKSLSS